MYAIVTFLTGGEVFAADADAIHSVGEAPEIIARFNAAPGNSAAVRDDGSGLLLVDLAMLLGKGVARPAPDARILYVQVEECAIAFLVDEVRDFTILEEGGLQFPDNMEETHTGAVPAQSCLHRGERLLLLDLSAAAERICSARACAATHDPAVKRIHTNSAPLQ
jgi:chemotaxis signal transduction protein